jgi:hypothetical protein
LPWEDDAWAARLAADNVLRHVEADQMAQDAQVVTDELDDLAVLVLFSVFEATVRDLVEAQVAPEVGHLRHAALIKAGKDVLRAIEEGSFFQLLEPYKTTHADLVEQVTQVRRHRNWVAHGRRPDKHPGPIVRPSDAYQRLKEFLAAVRGPEPAARSGPEGD